MTQTLQKTSLFQKSKTFLDEWLLFTFSSKLRFAIKVSLSLTLAFMIPMAMGWAQPNTAAITVMLIASAGGVGESVQKGLIRVIGTLLGATIGLSLIALFPQERLLYLLALSLVVAIIIYLYYSYQGDSTVFMLTAMVMMMVFLSGPEDAFIYGVDRTYMTIFGIVAYTFVGVFLWPVRHEDTTIEDAKRLSRVQSELFDSLSKATDVTASLQEKMTTDEQRLHHAYIERSDASFSMTLNASTWDAITHHYKEIGSVLSALAIAKKESGHLEYSDYIKHYTQIEDEIMGLFSGCVAAWDTDTEIALPSELEITYEHEKMLTSTHLQRSTLVTQAELLKKLHLHLCRLSDRLNTLNGGTKQLEHQDETPRPSRFIWLDPEAIKGTLQLLLVFWSTTAFWILFNPPGGFALVMLATLLGLLTTFSPLKPSILMVLFSIGFIFAIAMYLFVLPNLVYGWELALFLFFYTFIAFYLIDQKMTIFFLIGMFMLGISNTMEYDLALLLNTLLIFYMFLSIMMFFQHFPFSARPEYLFRRIKGRLFDHASALLKMGRSSEKSSWLAQRKALYHLHHLLASSARLRLWGSKIDTAYFATNDKESIMAFANACETLAYRTKELYGDDRRNETNSLIRELREQNTHNIMAEMTGYLALSDHDPQMERRFRDKSELIVQVETRLDRLRERLDPTDYTAKEITGLYVNLDLRHTLWRSLLECHETMRHIDWDDLKGKRF